MNDEAVAEKEMVKLYTQGYGIGAIAQKLDMSTRTVRLTLKAPSKSSSAKKTQSLGILHSHRARRMCSPIRNARETVSQGKKQAR